jgi:hypothetical protein
MASAPLVWKLFLTYVIACIFQNRLFLKFREPDALICLGGVQKSVKIEEKTILAEIVAELTSLKVVLVAVFLAVSVVRASKTRSARRGMSSPIKLIRNGTRWYLSSPIFRLSTSDLPSMTSSPHGKDLPPLPRARRWSSSCEATE